MRQALTGKKSENFRTEYGLTTELSAQSAQARKSVLSVLEVFKPRFGPFWPFPLQFLAIFSIFSPIYWHFRKVESSMRAYPSPAAAPNVNLFPGVS